MKKYDPKINRRRSVRIRNYDYSSSGYYFVTICTHEKKELFGEIRNGQMSCNVIGVMVHKIIIYIIEHDDRLELPEFIVMPNHVHGIIRIINSDEKKGLMNQTPTLGNIIRRFKASCSRKINTMDFGVDKLWQRNYYEHIIRNEESYLQIAEYIRTNPQRWKDDEYHVL